MLSVIEMTVPDPDQRSLGRLSEEMTSKQTPEKVSGLSQGNVRRKAGEVCRL